VIELKEHEGLCASLGRKIGATFAEEDWILFLDADMEITDEFHEWLSTFNKDTRSSGFVGKYKDIDIENNRIKYRVYKNVDGIAKYFGGAVLLKRAALFQSGNWASTIYSNEEIELYSRMIQKGFKVESIEELMVNHYTEIPTVKESLLYLVLMRNKKLSLGPSQVLIKAIKEKYFKNLFSLQPLPYSLFLINVMTVLLIIVSLKIALTWFVVAHVLVVIITRSVKRVCVAYISQYLIIMGLLLGYKKQSAK